MQKKFLKKSNSKNFCNSFTMRLLYSDCNITYKPATKPKKTVLSLD